MNKEQFLENLGLKRKQDEIVENNLCFKYIDAVDEFFEG